jgi:hypothetical protein
MFLVLTNLGISVNYGLLIQNQLNTKYERIAISQMLGAGLLIMKERVSIEYYRKIDNMEIYYGDKSIRCDTLLYFEGYEICSGYITTFQGINLGYIHYFKNKMLGISAGYYWGEGKGVGLCENKCVSQKTFIQKPSINILLGYYFENIKTAISFEFGTPRAITLKVIFK